MKKIFEQIDMGWKKVVIFAVITGLYTGLINLVPFLFNTSFRDIAISYEWWVLFAILIIVNCKKPMEAALKTFVFFLISQPLVYLVEMPFLGFTVWNYYKFWFIITLLTLPGGFIAFFIKKQNIIGTLVLSVALIIVSISAASYLEYITNNFPYHILSLLFCIVLIGVLIINIISNKGLRLFALMVSLVAVGVSYYYNETIENSVSVALPEGMGWSCNLVNDDKSSLFNDDYSITFSYKLSSLKNNSITCVSNSGETINYDIIVNNDKTSVNVFLKE